MPPQQELKPEVLDRLLLSKSFLEKIRFQPVAVHDRYTLASNIIAAHDAAEMAVAGICDQVGCLPQKGASYLMDYFEFYKKTRGVDLHAREYFRNLNTARNSLKHQGLFPDAKQWSRVGESVFQHITEWCWDNLTLSFSDLDESALLLDANVKQLYDEAKQSAHQQDYKAALEKLGLALSIVFEKNAALRGFEAGSASSEDAIRVVGFGIHGNDFLALQQFLPRVSRWGKDAGVPQWKQSGYGHPGNWRESSANFCLRVFVDVAVKLQDAPWIPGPLSRNVLYDQQIEALRDGVEFWRQVPDSTPESLGSESDSSYAWAGLFGKTKREIKQLLCRGEKLRANVRLVGASYGVPETASGVDLVNGEKVLSVTPLGDKYETWNVRASDVRVVCVPSESELVEKYFPGLPQIEWEPE
jgi:hypothetical protein